MAHYMLPFSNTEDILFNASKNVPSAEKLHTLPCPEKIRLVPFKDELARDPSPRGFVGKLAIASFIGLAALGYWGMHVRTASNTPTWGDVIASGEFPGNEIRLRYDYIGVSAIDNICRMLVSAFMPGIAAWDQGFYLLELYFLISLVPVVAIWTIESCRKRNSTNLLYLSSLWAILYQLNGIAIFAPLYYAAFLAISSDHTYWWPLSREVPLQYSRHILTSLLLGYVFPTILMFLPIWNSYALQGFIAFWQPSPVYVNVLLAMLSARFGMAKESDGTVEKQNTENPSADLPFLRTVYKVCLALTSLTHLGLFTTTLLSPSSSFILRHAFGFSSPFSWTFVEGLRNLWLADFWVWAAATMLFCFVSLNDLRMVGRSSLSVVEMLAVTLGGSVFFGPGAVLSGVWLYREEVMEKTAIARRE